MIGRVFVPREFRVAEGGSVFRTIDGETYRRLTDGSTRRAKPKVNGRVAKRERALARKREVRR